MNKKHLLFAKQQFGDKVNGAGLSLFEHSVRVALTVERMGYKGNIVTAALFHDLLEDTDTYEEQLLAVSNLEVLNMVRDLTIDTGKPFSKMSRSEIRKAVEPLKTYSEGTRVIKLADILDNVTMSMFTYSKNDRDFYRWWFMLLREYGKLINNWKKPDEPLYIWSFIDEIRAKITELEQFISVMNKK